MRVKKILIILGIILAVNYFINKIFKIQYSTRNVVLVNDLKINDSIFINNAYIVLGKNYKGIIEGTIFPIKEQRYNDQGIVEYFYLRFPPQWFEKNIALNIESRLSGGQKLGIDLIEKARVAHKFNFGYCCHFNDYPIVNDGFLFIRISLYGVADKITYFVDLK